MMRRCVICSHPCLSCLITLISNAPLPATRAELRSKQLALQSMAEPLIVADDRAGHCIAGLLGPHVGCAARRRRDRAPRPRLHPRPARGQQARQDGLTTLLAVRLEGLPRLRLPRRASRSHSRLPRGPGFSTPSCAARAARCRASGPTKCCATCGPAEWARQTNFPCCGDRHVERSDD